MLTYGNHFIGKRNNYLLSSYDPYNPLHLPPNTVRVRTNDGNVPIKDSGTTYETATLVPGTTDVFDVYKSGTDFTQLLFNSKNVTEVLGANTSGITTMYHMFGNCYALTTVALFDISNLISTYRMFASCKALTNVPLFDTSNITVMNEMFSYCISLTTVPLFDTSNVTSMREMFSHCYALTSIPLFDTTNVTNMLRMFYSCVYVESGALALYNQASSQTTPPANHEETFYNCGRDTVNGAAELAQIPSDWK